MIQGGSVFWKLEFLKEDVTRLKNEAKKIGDELGRAVNSGGSGSSGFSGLGDSAAKASPKINVLNGRVRDAAASVRILRNDFQSGRISADALDDGVERLNAELNQLRTNTNLTTQQTAQLATAQRSLTATSTAAAGGVSRLGLASQVALGNSRALQTALGGVTKAAFAGGAAFAAFAVVDTVVRGFKSAVEISAEFEKSMQRVIAVTGTALGSFGSQQEALAALTAEARRLGGTTEFTASEASSALAFLGQAGFSASQQLAALESTLNLASAGQLELGRSADIASNILSQYSLTAEETARVSDVLAKTSTSSNTNIEQLAEAFNYLGPTAQALGISLEETSATIGILGNAGLQGSLATRALGTSLIRLAEPTKKARAAIAEIGLEAFDAEGEFVGLAGIIEQLQTGFEDYTDQQKQATLSTIFGKEAIQELNILLNAGAEDLRGFTTELENSGGSAKTLADTQLEGLKGAQKELTSAWQESSIILGTIFLPVLEALTDLLADALKASNFLSSGFLNLFNNTSTAAKSLNTLRENSDKADGALKLLTGSTSGADGYNSAVKTLASTLDEEGSTALADFAKNTALPLVAQGKLQEAIQLTIEKFLELDNSDLLSRKASAERLLNRVSSEEDNINVEIEALRSQLQEAENSAADVRTRVGNGTLFAGSYEAQNANAGIQDLTNELENLLNVRLEIATEEQTLKQNLREINVEYEESAGLLSILTDSTKTEAEILADLNAALNIASETITSTTTNTNELATSTNNLGTVTNSTAKELTEAEKAIKAQAASFKELKEAQDTEAFALDTDEYITKLQEASTALENFINSNNLSQAERTDALSLLGNIDGEAERLAAQLKKQQDIRDRALTEQVEANERGQKRLGEIKREAERNARDRRIARYKEEQTAIAEQANLSEQTAKDEERRDENLSRIKRESERNARDRRIARYKEQEAQRVADLASEKAAIAEGLKNKKEALEAAASVQLDLFSDFNSGLSELNQAQLLLDQQFLNEELLRIQGLGVGYEAVIARIKALLGEVQTEYDAQVKAIADSVVKLTSSITDANEQVRQANLSDNQRAVESAQNPFVSSIESLEAQVQAQKLLLIGADQTTQEYKNAVLAIFNAEQAIKSLAVEAKEAGEVVSSALFLEASSGSQQSIINDFTSRYTEPFLQANEAAFKNSNQRIADDFVSRYRTAYISVSDIRDAFQAELRAELTAEAASLSQQAIINDFTSRYTIPADFIEANEAAFKNSNERIINDFTNRYTKAFITFSQVREDFQSVLRAELTAEAASLSQQSIVSRFTDSYTEAFTSFFNVNEAAFSDSNSRIATDFTNRYKTAFLELSEVRDAFQEELRADLIADAASLSQQAIISSFTDRYTTASPVFQDTVNSNRNSRNTTNLLNNNDFKSSQRELEENFANTNQRIADDFTNRYRASFVGFLSDPEEVRAAFELGSQGIINGITSQYTRAFTASREFLEDDANAAGFDPLGLSKDEIKTKLEFAESEIEKLREDLQKTSNRFELFGGTESEELDEKLGLIQSAAATLFDEGFSAQGEVLQGIIREYNELLFRLENPDFVGPLNSTGGTGDGTGFTTSGGGTGGSSFSEPADKKEAREREERRRLFEIQKTDNALDIFGKTLVDVAADKLPLLSGAIEGFIAGGPLGAAIAVFSELVASTTAWDEIQKAATESLQPLIVAFGTVVDAAAPLFIALIQSATAFTPVIEVIGKVLKPAFDFLAFVITGITDVIKNIVDGLINFYNATLGFIFGRVDIEESRNASELPEITGGAFGDTNTNTNAAPQIALSSSSTAATGAVTSQATLDTAAIFESAIDLFVTAVDTFDNASTRFSTAINNNTLASAI